MAMLQPLTQKCREWIDENVYVESWQWLNGMLAIDHHFIEDIQVGMLEAGYVEGRDYIVH